MSTLEVPDYVPGTSFTAYRSFRLPVKTPNRTGRMRSLYHDIEWPPAAYGGLVANCFMRNPALNRLHTLLRHVHPPRPCAVSPGKDCKSSYPCGIYAFRELAPLSSRRAQLGPVVAEVQLGGRVFIHETMYRAQYATVSALYDYVPSTIRHSKEQRIDRIYHLAEAYEVPVLHWDP